MFSQIVKSSNRKPNLLETDDGKEYVNKYFNEASNKQNNERYSRNTALGAVLAKKLIELNVFYLKSHCLKKETLIG